MDFLYLLNQPAMLVFKNKKILAMVYILKHHAFEASEYIIAHEASLEGSFCNCHCCLEERSAISY